MRFAVELKPILMGGAMGLMMLGMLHLMLTGNSDLGGIALALFIGAHLVIVGVLLGLGLFAARMSPKLRARLAQIHRPGMRQVMIMALSAGAVALLMHLILHGGI